jgi:thiol-disulfide isomerase/thioredoxin
MKPLNRIATNAPAGWVLAAVLYAIAAGMGLLYPTLWSSDNVAHAQSQVPPTNGLQALATGAMAAFKATEPPAPVEGIEIVDAVGKPRPLSEWKGRVVLLNLWATWCAPCLKEMPALDRLRAELGSADFDVIALNIDKTPEKPQKFVADNSIKSLEFLRDPTAKAFAHLKSQGMPTTLLLDRQGREIGRLVGPAEWDSAEAKALVKAAVDLK